MAKKGQLWDDSVLVKALDDAISKYKIMHSKEDDNGSLKEERISKDTEENGLNVFDGSNEIKSSFVETDNNITDVPKNTTRTGDPSDSLVTAKCTSEVVEQHVNPTIGDKIQETDYAYDNAESTEQYNVLLNQYNAVEQQRQKLLEQLYQYGNWDYQSYDYDHGHGHGHGHAYDSQYDSVSAPQTSEPPTCTCRPFVCPYLTTPAVSSCKTFVGGTPNGNSVSLKDDGFIKAAMGAVDKAMHSFNKETSGIPDVVDQAEKKEQEVEAASPTDLSAVLNAWFSAGFYTGKYLSEQASAKK